MNPRVSVNILTCNGKEFLGDCLNSVLRQSYDNFNVILVDNNSTDGSLDFVRDNFPEVEVIALDKNYGYPKGFNIGIKYALEKYNPDYFFLLNNDIKIVQDETIRRLIEIAQNDKETGILGCKLIFPDGRAQIVGGKINLASRYLFKWMDPAKEPLQEAYEVDIIIGVALFIKASVINKIGLFDEGFSPVMSEEIDLCMRIKRSSFLLKIVSSREIMHHLSQYMKRVPSDYMYWINKKNYIRFMLLNAPLYLIIIGILCEFYWTLKYLTLSVLDKKSKEYGFWPWNLSIDRNWRDKLILYFSPYFINIKNLREIIWKRAHRTAKLWF